MLQTRTTRWLAGTALLCVALLAAAYFLLVAPKRAEASALRDDNVAARQRNDALQIEIAQLKAQFAKLPEKQSELAAMLQQLPPTADVPRLVRDLDGLARSSGVTLRTVTPGPATYLAAAGTAGSSAASGSSGSSGTAAAGTGALGQVAQIPLTLVVHGDYYAELSFLKQLQHSMSRAVLLTGMQFSSSQSDSGAAGQADLTVTGEVFALPGAAAALAAGTAGSAAAGTGSAATAVAGSASAATPSASGTTTGGASTSTSSTSSTSSTTSLGSTAPASPRED